MTTQFPVVDQAVPYYVEAATVDGKAAWVDRRGVGRTHGRPRRTGACGCSSATAAPSSTRRTYR